VESRPYMIWMQNGDYLGEGTSGRWEGKGEGDREWIWLKHIIGIYENRIMKHIKIVKRGNK
jgi:hypothetical protein